MNEKLTFEQKVYAFAKEFRPSDKEIEEFKQFLNNDTQKEFIFKGRGVALIKTKMILYPYYEVMHI